MIFFFFSVQNYPKYILQKYIFLLLHGGFQDFTAKLSDFGLAKMGPEGSKSHVTTRVMGTYGYAAPEYVSTGLYTMISLSVFSVFIQIIRVLLKKRI